jgi:hypothetical protein
VPLGTIRDLEAQNQPSPVRSMVLGQIDNIMVFNQVHNYVVLSLSNIIQMLFYGRVLGELPQIDSWAR